MNMFPKLTRMASMGREFIESESDRSENRRHDLPAGVPESLVPQLD
jgi:hypothetical protein